MTETLRARCFTVAHHITGEKRPVVFLHAAEAEIESLRRRLKGAVERAEKAEAEADRLKRALAATEAELRYAAGLDEH